MTKYSTDECYWLSEDVLDLNYYGQPIVMPEYFMEKHVATVPVSAGDPPWCSCGWTRYRFTDGRYVEMYEHLADMQEWNDYLDSRQPAYRVPDPGPYDPEAPGSIRATMAR